MSALTMVMSVPQILTIWLSLLLWFWHAMRQRDRNTYLTCIGWIVLDSGVIMGAFVYG